ncbi:MAG: PEP-CTERM sorting domain-containing protein [Planctomycetota bacterium]
MKSLIRCVAMVATIGAATAAHAEFIDPASDAPPFADWDRGDADSLYAEWDVFTVPIGAPGNLPDVGSFPASGSTTAGADANVTQVFAPFGGPGAFITSGGNIYSFATVNDFDVTVPGYGYGAGYNTRFIAQVRTLGVPIDPSSVGLSFDGGAQALPPTQVLKLGGEALGGPFGASTDTLFAWDLAGSPSDFQFDFTAASSSLSLDRLAIDVYTQTGSFGSIPEPSAVGLMIAAAGSIASLRRRG